MSRPGNTRQSGFTLIELMVTIGVVAILAALAAPSFQSQIANYRAKNDAVSIAAFIQEIRSKALETRRSVTLSYDANQKMIFWDCNADGARSAASVNSCSPIGPEPFYRVENSDVLSNASAATDYNFVFDSRGVLNQTPITVSIKSTSGSASKSYSVTVERTGKTLVVS
jgi:type IV fimbrial biogenesis protein FimT